MARYHYERLNAAAASYLLVESSRRKGHSATTLVFDAGPLATKKGGIDFEAVRDGIQARLPLVPRLTQKLKWIPYEDHPVWVDDAEFNLAYHLRHSSLPRPGNEDQLDELVARLMARRLDRSRPLWELWVVEGLEGGRFALVLKLHQCMTETDGDASDLFGALLSDDAEAPEPEAPELKPRPVPSSLELVRDELGRRLALPGKAAMRFATFARESGSLRHEVGRRTQAVAQLLGYTIRAADETPLNAPIGPHRRFERLVIPVDKAQYVHRELGGSVNDVILGTVAGAVRRYFARHYMNPSTLDFRVAMPVSVEAEDAAARPKRGATAPDPREMTEWVIDLPIWERNPVRRLEAISEQTADYAREAHPVGARTLFSMARWSGSRFLAQGARQLSTHSGANLIVLNIPGSPDPLYFRGAKLLEAYGQAPIHGSKSLGIAVMSYDGTLCFGLNADYDRVADLRAFRDDLEAAFLELLDAAGSRPRLEVVKPERRKASRKNS